MKKINFTKITFYASFEDEDNNHNSEINLSKHIGNLMKYDSAAVMDIGWEDLARTIYNSTDEVTIPDNYVNALVSVIKGANLKASIKRAIINLLK